MAVTKTDQGSTRHLKTRVNYFNLSVPTDKAKWDALFVPGTDLLNLNNRKWRAGHQILDVLTGTRLTIANNNGLLSWSAPGVKIYAANDTIEKNTLVKFDSGGVIVAGSAQGERYNGVAMNDAEENGLVYVMSIGCYLVLAGTNAVTVGDNYSVGTGGNAGKTDPTASDDNFMGMKLNDVPIDAVDYDCVTISGTCTILV